MKVNPVLFYQRMRNAEREIRRGSQSPAVIDNKLAALKMLAASMLNEVASLEGGQEKTVQADLDFGEEVKKFETSLIKSALIRTGGRQRQAARLLHLKPTTLHEKMKRYGILQAEIHDEVEAFPEEDTDAQLVH